MTSLVTLWTEARRRLEAAGVDTPVIDARLLLEAGAGVSRLDIVTDPRRELTEAQAEAVRVLVARRETREPMSHILGRRGFWTLDLKVTPDVLTPRPESELVVEVALEALPVEAPSLVLDLGAGSGAILLAILSERPHARGVGVDVSPEALAVARANAEAHRLSDRVEWRLGGWNALSGAFDAVVSNPPYIPTAEIQTLSPEVAQHEPRLALDGGVDGLDAYRAIVPRLPDLVRPGGRFALEVGAGQGESVAALARGAGLRELEIRGDLAGVGRVVAGRRPAWE